MAAHNERRHPAKRARSCATRNPRLRGCSPLRTPKRWSKKQKAKTCRSAARFLTLFASSPFDPSGAKYLHSVGADARHRPAPGKRQFAVTEKRPPCVKGAVTVGDWGIVTLLIHRPTLVRSQSLRHGYAVPPAYASGPSVAARHLPTLWGVTLYTGETLGSRNLIG